jgi:hypothetical protein
LDDAQVRLVQLPPHKRAGYVGAVLEGQGDEQAKYVPFKILAPLQREEDEESLPSLSSPSPAKPTGKAPAPAAPAEEGLGPGVSAVVTEDFAVIFEGYLQVKKGDKVRSRPVALRLCTRSPLYV